MRRHLLAALAAVLCFAGALPVSAAEINVFPWLAPNAFGSPSFAGAEANAVQAMKDGGIPTGTPGTPTYFESRSNVTSQEVVVTGFPSWLGQADPGAVFGPAFSAELGNRMTFALRVDGLGTQFAIADLGFSATSTDPFNALAFGFGPGSYGYSNAYQGVLAGLDNTLWTGDDTYVTGGPAAQLVDGLVGRGSGNSFAAYCPGCTIYQQMAAIAGVAAYPGTAFDFTGTYTIGASSGSGTFTVNPVPLPAALPLLLSGLGGLGLVGWRRRKTARGAATLA